MTAEENIEKLIMIIAKQSDLLQNSFLVAVENLSKNFKDLEQTMKDFEKRLEEVSNG